MNAAQQESKPVSGFARKKFLESNGFSVQKLHNPSLNAEEWCVLDGPNDGAAIIAAHRLQGEAVSKAIDALGGM